uniref:Pyrin domain-containing protein n=1 Tax=Monopterus albus TaxID=43700 RepID=A0A3Q3KF51_MONAL
MKFNTWLARDLSLYEYPAYVGNWTKQQVNQWLLQHVKVYGKYGQRLLDEDVSGNCLVCFKKQDLLDLDVKSGPAVKIMAELRSLNKKPEPTLQPIPHTSTDQTEASKSFQPELSLAQATTTKQPESKNQGMGEHESGKAQLTSGSVSARKENQQPPPENVGVERKEKLVGKTFCFVFYDIVYEVLCAGCSSSLRNSKMFEPDISMITLILQKKLENLFKDDFKNFHFHLCQYKTSKFKPISQGKLEGKDTMDTARLMTDYYQHEAVYVTIDILKDINQRQLASELENEMGKTSHGKTNSDSSTCFCIYFDDPAGPLKQPRLSEDVLKREANQGDKLKNLLTCGSNSLDNYERFVVVVNKSSPQQQQYLQFLSKLKLFCVLDFDPNSAAPGGLCHSYRESRVANLHTPAQYQGQTDLVIKNLNLYRQTSWVFCNGRHDLDSDSNKELDYKNWLRKSCRDVEQLVALICNPEVLPPGRRLIIFLLLSPVHNEKDPVFETYRALIKHTEEESIITICESRSTYLKWRELIQEKCDFEIDRLSIYELTLSEISGTIMAMGPQNQSCGRLLPSSGSSAVILKQKDEDCMTALDILCLNQCENIYDENSSEFQDFRVKVEEEFYRGGKVKWWNFYFCDKDKEKPFVKRDKYETMKKMIRSLSKESKPCDLLNLFHHPGCGGTTLAMHVMWDLRQEFRCAVLKDNTLPKTEVAVQVSRLMKLDSEKPSPVLLLVDDSKETENAHDLVHCIYKDAVVDGSVVNVNDAPSCKVIVLNCVRSCSPKEQYQRITTPSQYITASLKPEEQKDFEKKLKELKETHEKPENFYSFMIMKSNFDKKYINDLARNTLESFDFSTKKAQLFAFLALLNTYAAESEISLSLCEDFFGMKMFYSVAWKDDSVLHRMEPYSNLLIIDRVEDWGGYKAMRIVHYSIAAACLEELERSCFLKVSDIVMEILHCDLFFSVGVVKHKFVLSIRQMLIERQRKKDSNEREQFSPLIDKIHSQQGRQTVQEILEKASPRFETSASIPQALARYLYINERDFPEAVKWAEKAKNIKENPYTFDTIGQVYKSNLKCNIDKEKQETSHNPEDLNTNMKLAQNAIRAFKRAQELANIEDGHDEAADGNDSEDYPKKSYTVYGYVGVLDIASLIFEILSRLPFFEESDPMKKKYLQSFLKGALPITSVYMENNEINNRYVEIIKEHDKFLLSLKTEVKEIFDLLNCYFMYIKGNNSEFDIKNHFTVCSHFKKYVTLFCSAPEEVNKERQNNPNLNLKINIEERRLFLEEKQADTFAGILYYLDKPAKEIEEITECYVFLQQQQNFVNKKQKTKETINYILSNIVLYIVKPKSKHVKSYSYLSDLLLKTLQDVGLHYPYPDPYYLALLLFWPSPTQENKEIVTYVKAIRKSYRKRLTSLFPNRSTVAHLYLGKEEELKRLVSKPQLDENFKPMRRDALAQLWRSGDIFRDKAIINPLHRVTGTIEQGEVYANYAKLKIPVRPALIGGIRSCYSTEKVSFYVGFAISGPLAYDIQYEN